VRILLDHGTPAPLRGALAAHSVATAYEQGWATLANGQLLAVAEDALDVLITTDQNLRHQQKLAGRRSKRPGPRQARRLEASVLHVEGYPLPLDALHEPLVRANGRAGSSEVCTVRRYNALGIRP
jgi:hypothetical protein